MRLVPDFYTANSFNYMAESNEIRLAFLPYTFTGLLNNLPPLRLQLTEYRLQDVRDMNLLLNQDQIASGYQITVTEVASNRGISIREAFNDVPISTQRNLVMSLTLDVTSYVRLHRKSDSHWIILCNKLSHGLMLRIACIIPILFPTYKDINFMPNELPILLAQDKYDQYCSVLSSWLMPQYEQAVQEQRWVELRRALGSIRSEQLNRLKNEIDSRSRDINDHLDSLQYLYDQLNDLMLQHTGMINTGDEAYNDLFNYIKRKSCVKNITTTETAGEVCFSVSVPLTNWDVQLAEANLNAAMSNEINNSWHKDAVIDLLIKQEARLWFAVVFRLNFIKGTVSNNGFDTFLAGIPNRHIHQHNCWGNNKTAVLTAVRNRQLEAAFEQALSACGTLNMADGTVLNGMFRALRMQESPYNRPCIEVDTLPEWLTWKEYVAYVQQKNIPTLPPEPVQESNEEEEELEGEHEADQDHG